ncbi:tyrosine-type recombinase/integrase [Dickeya ananatis]|uniref:tyrosine-type recombinase/integrase n=1 Tax=Dickeya ananatis TaxID=3061286 RepID=UPI0038904F00
MAYYSIEKRPRADGTVRYRCTVGVKEKGKYIYRENKTFGKQAHAKAWGARRVAEIEERGVPSDSDASRITIRDLLLKYIADPALGGKAGRTKRYVLDMLVDCDIAEITLSDLTVNDVVEHGRLRAGAGAGPSTVGHDISYLSSVLAAAKPILGIDYTANPVAEARIILTSLGFVGKSQRRSRRPVNDELARLEKGLQARQEHRAAAIPFVDILNFSIWSCMRIGEVCRIRWDDIDEKQKAVLVRDRKDPRKKDGNHMMVPLLSDAWDIVQRQPRKSELIFPYSSKSVTAGFQRVRNALGIEDLRYHDLRREGASRLFEAGFSIEEVAQVTGHRSLNVLWQVYRELYPGSLHKRFDELRNRNHDEQ